MSIAIHLKIKDDATPAFQRLAAAVQRAPSVRAAMGEAIAGKLRHNFRRLDRTRTNKLGGTRTGFYGRAVKAVQQPALTPGGVSVSIVQQGIAQRFFGGEITPKSGKYLTLPVHPLAYGKRAREFSDLQFIALDGGRRAILVRPNDASPNGIGEIFYALVRRVHQQPDPSVLPTDEELNTAALTAGDEHLANLIARAQRG